MILYIDYIRKRFLSLFVRVKRVFFYVINNTFIKNFLTPFVYKSYMINNFKKYFFAFSRKIAAVPPPFINYLEPFFVQ